MAKAWHACPTPGCPAVLPPDQRRCSDCSTHAEHRRGSAAARGYGHRHRTRFRRGVLDRDPICVLCWRVKATHADHYPKGRDELELLGLDADDPQYGRGLCASCDSNNTAARQPGGYTQR